MQFGQRGQKARLAEHVELEQGRGKSSTGTTLALQRESELLLVGPPALEEEPSEVLLLGFGAGRHEAVLPDGGSAVIIGKAVGRRPRLCYRAAVPAAGAVRRQASALACLAAAILSAPAGAAEEAPYLFVLSRLLAEEGEIGAARDHLTQAVELAAGDPYLHLEYAALLANLGRWREASAEATRARELAPENPEVLRAYGQIHLVQARDNPAAIDRAREAFEDLRTRTPGDLESQLALGRIYLGQGRADEATAIYQDLLAYWPAHPVVRSGLVDALIRSGRKGEAEKTLTDFLAVEPSALEFRLTLADLLAERGEHARAVEVLEAADAAAQNRPELSRRLALALYRAGDPERALARLESWLEAEPGDLRARLLQSLLLSALGREADATEVLESLRRSRPDDLEVATLLTRHHTSRHAWRAALAVSEPLLEDGVDAEHAELALLSAEALRGEGRGLEALDRLALVGAQLEQHPRAVAMSAEILFDLERAPEAEQLVGELLAEDEPERLVLAAAVYQRAERYPDAIRVLERILAQQPGRIETLFWLGAAYERTRDYVRAEDSFRRLLAVEPDFAPALNYLGYMWAERGTNLDEALAMVERAVTLEPDNGAYLDSLGWAHYQKGDYAAARGPLERAAELTGEDATVLEHLGDVYLALGQVEDASSAYQRALELHDENTHSLQRKLESLARPD